MRIHIISNHNILCRPFCLGSWPIWSGELPFCLGGNGVLSKLVRQHNYIFSPQFKFQVCILVVDSLKLTLTKNKTESIDIYLSCLKKGWNNAQIGHMICNDLALALIL